MVVVGKTISLRYGGCLCNYAGSYARINSHSIRQNPSPTIKNHFVSQLIGAYKTPSSKWIHLAGCALFKWQRSHYFKVIFKQEQIDNITRYINKTQLNGMLQGKIEGKNKPCHLATTGF